MTRRGRVDAIALVEIAYDVGAGDEEWLAAITAAASDELDQGLGLAAWRYRVGESFEPRELVHRNMAPAVVRALVWELREHRERARGAHRKALPFATVSQALGIRANQVATHPIFTSNWHPLGVRDWIGVNAVDASGNGVMISAPQAHVKRPPRREIERWSRIAAHLVAGSRLRRTLDRDEDATKHASAVISADGREILHAEHEAKDRREALRRAARAMDRARGRLRRHDQEEALALWEGLVDGEWSLIDHFDSDGRRFLVARKNAPDVRDPRGLTPRERQVLAYTVLGHSLKLIAYELGITISTVAEHRKQGMRKLGAQRLIDLARLIAPA